MKKNKFNEDYYERGQQLGISGYTDYRWLPELTIPMCRSIVKYLEIKEKDLLLDFGCAKGFIVKGFNDLGYNCFGTDISQYAISKSPSDIRNKIIMFSGYESIEKILSYSGKDKFDFIISKDVFEHIEYSEIESIVSVLSRYCNALFVVVPLALNQQYVVTEYEGDVTHIIREDMHWWLSLFIRNGFRVCEAKHQVKGIKENWSHYPKGNGFFSLNTY